MSDDCTTPHPGHDHAADRGPQLLSTSYVEEIAATFAVLGDPTRVRILDALSAGELCVCDIAGLAAISESAVSHQLRLLRGMRLVRARRAGRQVFYTLDDQHIAELLRLAVTHVQESAVEARQPRLVRTGAAR
jgi:ArsR family transcriptional regulator, lead/cadmium/zinc/bismuth-responsive transcriptional repressor